MRRILIGDLHGNFKGLHALLSKVDYAISDKLIFVGDYNDHFSGIGCSTKILIHALIRLRDANPDNVHFVLGNHDKWFLDWMDTRQAPNIWYDQGGKETLNAYLSAGGYNVPDSHVRFYKDLKPYYVDEKVVVAHGGIPEHLFEPIVKGDALGPQDADELLWDREMVFAWSDFWFNKYKKYFGDRIFVCGHTAHRGPYKNANMPWYMIDTDFRGNGLCALVIDGDQTPVFVMYDPKKEIL